jgi:1,4-alpha-glucan branching enzyme
VIRVSKVAKSNDVKVTFSLPQEQPSGTVSVVGDFNDWTPGAHLLHRGDDGTLSATVTMPAGRRIHFRYLASGGRWFNDPEADAHDGQGSLLEL